MPKRKREGGGGADFEKRGKKKQKKDKTIDPNKNVNSPWDPSLQPKKDIRHARKLAKMAKCTARPEKAVACYENHVTAVLRALKKARGFERQRMTKRIAEEKKSHKQTKGKLSACETQPKANPTEISATYTTGIDSRELGAQKIERLEREMVILRNFDFEVAARVHLANTLLRHKLLAKAPGPLADHLRSQKRTSVEEGASNGNSHVDSFPYSQHSADVHNVSSALYNRPFVKHAVANALVDICTLLAIEKPERAKKPNTCMKNSGRQKTTIKASDEDGSEDEEYEWNAEKEDSIKKRRVLVSNSDGGETQAFEEDATPQKANTKATNTRMSNTVAEEMGSDSGDGDFELEREREFTKYDDILGDYPPSEDDSDDDSDVWDKEALRSRYVTILANNKAGTGKESEYESGDVELGSDSSEDLDESKGDSVVDDDDEESSEDEMLRPRKHVATAAVSAASHFLPSLMGGYVSDGNDANRDFSGDEDDEAIAVKILGGPRKNRRGQRARQAIWEKRYKQNAKHVQEAEQKTKGNRYDTPDKGGWDAKRGAVNANDAPRWLRRKMGNFTKKTTHSQSLNGMSAPAGHTKVATKKDDSGPLHPSWEAAKKAKEKAQTATFEGKKVVFD